MPTPPSITDAFVTGFLAARDYYGGTDAIGDHHGAECHKKINTRTECTCHRNDQVVIAGAYASMLRHTTRGVTL